MHTTNAISTLMFKLRTQVIVVKRFQAMKSSDLYHPTGFQLTSVHLA